MDRLLDSIGPSSLVIYFLYMKYVLKVKAYGLPANTIFTQDFDFPSFYYYVTPEEFHGYCHEHFLKKFIPLMRRVAHRHP
jgi:hypothetical protein